MVEQGRWLNEPDRRSLMPNGLLAQHRADLSRNSALLG
jgi:hypothetical protein